MPAVAPREAARVARTDCVVVAQRARGVARDDSCGAVGAVAVGASDPPRGEQPVGDAAAVGVRQRDAGVRAAASGGVVAAARRRDRRRPREVDAVVAERAQRGPPAALGARGVDLLRRASASWR